MLVILSAALLKAAKPVGSRPGFIGIALVLASLKSDAETAPPAFKVWRSLNLFKSFSFAIN